VEDVVNRDGLWTSLLTGLSITEWSDSPLSYKLRVFENCCTVLDATLSAESALEDSQKVDWRTPELSLLLQHFELFITRCFKSAFMVRAISFCVDVIVSRLKSAVQTFKGDIDREDAVCFRSEWDVASLARLIFTFTVVYARKKRSSGILTSMGLKPLKWPTSPHAMDLYWSFVN